MKNMYTFSQLVDFMVSRGCNNADIAIADMMDIIETETGKWPNWDDIAPEWVVKQCGL